VADEVLTPVLQFSPIVGVDRNQALDCRARILLTFSTGNENATKSTVTNVALFAHGCYCGGSALTTVATHLFRAVLVVLRGVFECQPDALTLVIFPGGLINGTFSADLAAIRNFSHFPSLGVPPNWNLRLINVIGTHIILQELRQRIIAFD
jgi:hypothetical protein